MSDDGSGFALGADIFTVASVELRPLPGGCTATEREVVELVLRGFSDREVAAYRGTSVRTVANQLSSIYGKLGVNSRAELVAWCCDA
ncbi:MAG TPA: helix-turn-helix transcriptional regulator [Kofleriaceae bacterium]|jgi:DNA-binding CsgD family transcriptional regulator|nr:helix-turn-helix transcriptional regulator [Kofleriaceae bacterium]